MQLQSAVYIIVSAPVTQVITYLPNPEGWKAELADPQWTV